MDCIAKRTVYVVNKYAAMLYYFAQSNTSSRFLLFLLHPTQTHIRKARRGDGCSMHIITLYTHYTRPTRSGDDVGS